MKHLVWNKHTKLVLRHAVGWLFIVLGILGCFLPILQGILFLAIGVFLLADYVPFFGRIRDWIHRKFPHITERVHEMGRRFKARFHRDEGP